MRRILIAIVALSGVVLAVVVAALTMWGGDEAAQATPDIVVTTLAIDMDPFATPANDEDTVGTIEHCKDMANTEGATFDVDVVLDAIPNFGASRTNDLGAFNYHLYFPGGTANLSAQMHWDGGGSVAILDRAAGSGSNLSFTEALPDADGLHKVAEADFGTSEVGTGGVLGRYTFTVQPAAASGLYYLTLDTLSVSDGAGFDIWDAPGDGVDKDEDGAIDEDILLDGSIGYGVIALGVSCPPAPGQPEGPAIPEQPAATPDLLLEWQRIRLEEEAKPRFEGVVNGIRLYPTGAAPAVQRKDACTGARGEGVEEIPMSEVAGTPMEIAPTYLPPGSEEVGPTWPPVMCKGILANVQREWVIRDEGAHFRIARRQGEHANAIDASAERVSPATVGGKPAVLVKPLTPEGYGYSMVIVAEDFGITSVVAFGLPLEETVKVAEGLK